MENKTFKDLGLSQVTLSGVDAVGFKTPTEIQAKLIPMALEGKDLIGLAQTGSGKTAAFVLPVVDRLHSGEGVRGLILSPTREIALQTDNFIKQFGQGRHIKSACLIGGVRYGPQLEELKNKPDIIVATPGRLIDHVKKKNVDISQVEELVLDEADHMLDLGFLPQIRDIIRFIPKDRHTMMFSATMPSTIEGLAKQYLNDPTRVDVLPPERAAAGITHKLYLVDRIDKPECLKALLKHLSGSTLVFTNTREDANWILKILEHDKVSATAIHSDRNQKQRVRALEGFREGKYRVLIATGIASRGIDVKGIEHVINYDIPESSEEYIHRAGRTARAGAEGIVSSIGTWMDRSKVIAIEGKMGKSLPRCEMEGIESYKEIKLNAAPKRRRR